MKPSEKHIKGFEKMFTLQMQDVYEWVSYIHMDYDGPDPSKNRHRGRILYTVEFFEDDIPDFGEQMALAKEIGRFHKSLGLDLFYSYSSMSVDREKKGFPLAESTNKTDKYVEYVFRQVVREIKLIYKRIVYMESSDKTKLTGMQVPGVNYEEDDYHFFSYFSDDLFDRKKNSDDYEFDHLDDQEFYEYLRDKYGFPKELLPQLQKKLERWSKETDPNYKKPITESEDKLEKYYDYIAKDIIDRMEFNDPIFDHMAELYGESVNTCNLHASIDGIIQNMYGASGIEVLEVVVRVKRILDKIKPHRCDPNYRG
jgi:hypothetical protein